MYQHVLTYARIFNLVLHKVISVQLVFIQAFVSLCVFACLNHINVYKSRVGGAKDYLSALHRRADGFWPLNNITTFQAIYNIYLHKS